MGTWTARSWPKGKALAAALRQIKRQEALLVAAGRDRNVQLVPTIIGA